MACGVWKCNQVAHVRQCAIWKMFWSVIKIVLHQRASLIKRGSKFVVHPNFELPERREKRRLEISGTQGEPATLYARRFAHGHWSFLGPGSEKKW